MSLTILKPNTTNPTTNPMVKSTDNPITYPITNPMVKSTDNTTSHSIIKSTDDSITKSTDNTTSHSMIKSTDNSMTKSTDNSMTKSKTKTKTKTKIKTKSKKRKNYDSPTTSTNSTTSTTDKSNIITHKDFMILINGQTIGIQNRVRAERGSDNWNQIIKTGIFHNSKIIDLFLQPIDQYSTTTTTQSNTQSTTQSNTQSNTQSTGSGSGSTRKHIKRHYKNKGIQHIQLKTPSQHLADIRRKFGYKSQGTRSAYDQLLIYGGNYHGLTLKQLQKQLTFSQKQIKHTHNLLSSNPTQLPSTAQNFIHYTNNNTSPKKKIK